MTPKKDGNRFDDLFGMVKSKQPEKVEPEIEQPVEGDRPAKHKDPGYQRTTLYIPKQLHRKLKAAAAEEDREMSEIMEELIQQWLESRNV